MMPFVGPGAKTEGRCHSQLVGPERDAVLLLNQQRAVGCSRRHAGDSEAVGCVEVGSLTAKSLPLGEVRREPEHVVPVVNVAQRRSGPDFSLQSWWRRCRRNSRRRPAKLTLHLHPGALRQHPRGCGSWTSSGLLLVRGGPQDPRHRPPRYGPYARTGEYCSDSTPLEVMGRRQSPSFLVREHLLLGGRSPEP